MRTCSISVHFLTENLKHIQNLFFYKVTHKSNLLNVFYVYLCKSHLANAFYEQNSKMNYDGAGSIVVYPSDFVILLRKIVF